MRETVNQIDSEILEIIIVLPFRRNWRQPTGEI
jgi:hypothetical protein